MHKYIHEYILMSLALLILKTDSSKLRSWIGPENFWDGMAPEARNSHGFASSDGGTLYVFGGIGAGK